MTLKCFILLYSEAYSKPFLDNVPGSVCTGPSWSCEAGLLPIQRWGNAAQTSPMAGQGTHPASAEAQFKPRLPGACPTLRNHIITIMVQVWHVGDTHPMSDYNAHSLVSLEEEIMILPSINLLASWAPGRPCFFPLQSMVPPLAKMCLLPLCSLITPNLAFRNGVRSHTPI